MLSHGCWCSIAAPAEAATCTRAEEQAQELEIQRQVWEASQKPSLMRKTCHHLLSLLHGSLSEQLPLLLQEELALLFSFQSSSGTLSPSLSAETFDSHPFSVSSSSEFASSSLPSPSAHEFGEKVPNPPGEVGESVSLSVGWMVASLLYELFWISFANWTSSQLPARLVFLHVSLMSMLDLLLLQAWVVSLGAAAFGGAGRLAAVAALDFSAMDGSLLAAEGAAEALALLLSVMAGRRAAQGIKHTRLMLYDQTWGTASSAHWWLGLFVLVFPLLSLGSSRGYWAPVGLLLCVAEAEALFKNASLFCRLYLRNPFEADLRVLFSIHAELVRLSIVWLISSCPSLPAAWKLQLGLYLGNSLIDIYDLVRALITHWLRCCRQKPTPPLR
ncbi:MAG: hypothetical protein Q8P67_22435 [archaeon]|nr:hypothetical protein [archaeon]